MLGGTAAALGAAVMARQTRAASLAADPIFDVVVYGGTMSGICAAVAAAREGRKVALITGLSPIGGISSNGMSHADLQSPGFAGGLALEFYTKIGQYYGSSTPVFNYEPHVALHIAIQYLREYPVTVYIGQLGHVDQAGASVALILQGGMLIFARYVVDSSCEGDLMAALGVSYRIGRESETTYNEPLAGFGQAYSDWDVDPYGVDGEALAGVSPKPGTPVGQADRGVQAYCYRLCITDDTSNRIPFFEPPLYDPLRYRLVKLLAGETFVPGVHELPNNKYDLDSNNDLMCTDFVGGSAAYPESSGAARTAIVNQHFYYQAGLMYFLANDPSVPVSYRESTKAYGLAADEFIHNRGWPRQLYIREGRRLAGRYTLTQQDVQTESTQPDSIGVGFFVVDCHPVMRYPENSSTTVLEGYFTRLPPAARPVVPYEIPYGSLTPQAFQSKNLLVSICASASHIGYTSLRMEHQYMIMGEAAGVAAALASQASIPVQDVNIADLQSKLTGYGAKLHPF